MGKLIRVLIVEDSQDDALLLERHLRKGGYELVSKRVETAAAMKTALTRDEWDVVLCDHSLPGFDAPAALDLIKQMDLDIPFIIVSGKVSEEIAVSSMKAGAHDFLSKDNLTRLVPALEREMREAQIRRERLKSRQEKARWEAKFRLLAENIEDVLCLCTPDNDAVVYANPAYEKIWGQDRKGLYESRWSCVESIHPEDRARFLASTINLARTAPYSLEYRIVKPDGAIRWIHHRGFPVRDERGNLSVIAVLATDITERKQAENALATSEKELRHLSSRLLTAQEEERKRIARELHDSVGQNFVAIKVSIRNVIAEMNKGNVEEAAVLLQQLLPAINKAIEETRLIYTGLRPTVLDDLGIVATINWFVQCLREVDSARHIETETEINEVDIPDKLKIIIFRIVQEALNNIIKYSEADRVNISLAGRSGRIELTISDNGAGFDLAEVAARKNPGRGLGLTSMRERVEFSGGIFRIDSAIGKGTRIAASWLHPKQDRADRRDPNS